MADVIVRSFGGAQTYNNDDLHHRDRDVMERTDDPDLRRRFQAQRTREGQYNRRIRRLSSGKRKRGHSDD